MFSFTFFPKLLIRTCIIFITPAIFISFFFTSTYFFFSIPFLRFPSISISFTMLTISLSSLLKIYHLNLYRLIPYAIGTTPILILIYSFLILSNYFNIKCIPLIYYFFLILVIINLNNLNILIY